MVDNIFDRLKLLKAVVTNTETARRINTAAAFRVIAEYEQRIFFLGLDSEGLPIGVYSTNPFYINPDSLVGLPTSGITPEGKTGKTEFKSGKPHKTKYLTRGYAELREITDRQSGKVDLNLTGSLLKSIKVTQSGEQAKVTYTIDSLADIMEGNEERFGKTISEPTEEEINAGTEAARLELLAILEEIDTF